MKAADFPGVPEIARPAANGHHKPAKKNGAASRRAASADAPALAAPEELAGPIGCEDAAPIDAPMWPLQSAMWFQPDVAPAPPAWSGLAIERHNRIPTPDFLPSDTAARNCPGALEHSPAALPPAAAASVPESGLDPLGWDPRAICWKEKGQ